MYAYISRKCDTIISCLLFELNAYLVHLLCRLFAVLLMLIVTVVIFFYLNVIFFSVMFLKVHFFLQILLVCSKRVTDIIMGLNATVSQKRRKFATKLL